MLICALAALELFAAAVAAPSSDELVARESSWRSLGRRGNGTRATALAVHPAGDWAIGDETGIEWWDGSERSRASLPVVVRLAFDRDRRLWAATEEGLFVWVPGRRPRRRSLLGNDGSVPLVDLAVEGSAVLVASPSGIWWSSKGESFERLSTPGTGSGIRHVAMEWSSRGGGIESDPSGSPAPPKGVRIFLLGDRNLIEIHGLTGRGRFVVEGRAWHSLPRPSSERAPVDLVLDERSEGLHVVYPDLIASTTRRGPPGTAARGSRSLDWVLHRPNLSPGASLRTIRFAGERVLFVSDRGLREADRLEGPSRDIAVAAGADDCVELSPNARGGPLALCDGRLIAEERRLVTVRSEAGGGQRTASSGPSFEGPLRSGARSSVALIPDDPPLAEIRRRAWERSGLSAREAIRLSSGLRRRGFWPELEIQFGAEFDRDENADRDQSFVSGGTRHLFDRSRDEGQRFDASLRLEWDLGELAYPLESVDLSRELRQVLSLRDDVADEIHQLYVERQRIREQLASGSIDDPAERMRLRWRAVEIGAGLDAWTGGWISRWRADREVSTP